jgi:hypothetical protein
VFHGGTFESTILGKLSLLGKNGAEESKVWDGSSLFSRIEKNQDTMKIYENKVVLK